MVKKHHISLILFVTCLAFTMQALVRKSVVDPQTHLAAAPIKGMVYLRHDVSKGQIISTRDVELRLVPGHTEPGLVDRVGHAVGHAAACDLKAKKPLYGKQLASLVR